ncbi:MAG: hypothetical protein KKH94_06505 [Candidatus Omnitrophica bacterium]|nr:hypothetical protein [Candidatus Omnitrophota bacterium]
MTISDWMVVVAIILAPLLAIQVQKFIENFKEAKGRKRKIFKILMATRTTPLSPSHVEALNMIDIDFYTDKKVVNAWKELLDNFANYPQNQNSEDYKTQIQISSDKSKELLTNLLYEMSIILGYNFDKTLIKRGCYIPIAHGLMEVEQAVIRRGLTQLFLGKACFPISLKGFPPEGEKKEEKL